MSPLVQVWGKHRYFYGALFVHDFSCIEKLLCLCDNVSISKGKIEVVSLLFLVILPFIRGYFGKTKAEFLVYARASYLVRREVLISLMSREFRGHCRPVRCFFFFPLLRLSRNEVHYLLLLEAVLSSQDLHRETDFCLCLCCRSDVARRARIVLHVR